MNRQLLFIPLFFGLLFLSNSLIVEDVTLQSYNPNNKIESISIILLPNATISGTTQVCKDDNPKPKITFTGSGGPTPYTFIYTINGGAPQSIITTGNNNSVDLTVDTAIVGTFVYQLESVEDGSGALENVTGSATIKVSEPEVDFTFTNNDTCSGTLIQFIPNVTGEEPFDYTWSFGDGDTSSASNPTHIFSSLGCGDEIFNVTLTATDNFGCSNTVTYPVSVKQQPNINFGEEGIQPWEDPFNNCGSNTTNPEYSITVEIDSSSDTCISSYDINWGDGNSQSNIVFPLSHTYLQLGSFNMAITSHGDNGCSIVKEYLVKNSSNPTGAVLNPGDTVDLCLPVDPIDFTIIAWGDNPPDTVYVVDFGDGTIETYIQSQLESSPYYNAADPTASANYPIPHTYTESNCPNNFYTVIMTISTSCGQSVSSAGPIIILKKPGVDFEFDNIVCVNSTVLFNNTTIDGYSENCTTSAAFFWDFGDGSTSTDVNPTHVYSSSGNYNITLYAINFCGQTEPIVKTICVESPLIPGFTINNNDGCTPLAVNTTNTTDESDSCGSPEYLWVVTYTPNFD